MCPSLLISVTSANQACASSAGGACKDETEHVRVRSKVNREPSLPHRDAEFSDGYQGGVVLLDCIPLPFVSGRLGTRLSAFQPRVGRQAPPLADSHPAP